MDDPTKIKIANFPGVSNTALMTLYCRAMDARAKRSILHDEFAYSLYTRIECDWRRIKKHLRHHDIVFTAIRGRKFDQMCKQFLDQHPKGIIISLGAGLDNRFSRIDNGELTFIDLDLPEVIEFKKQIVTPSSRYMLIGKSVLDYSWITQISELSSPQQKPVYIISEGLLPYLEKAYMQELFKNISIVLPSTELFFDVCGEKYYQLMSLHSGIQDWNVQLKNGVRSGHEIETWGVGFHLLEEWFYPMDPDAKRGIMKFMWILPLFKYWNFFIHGKLDARTL